MNLKNVNQFKLASGDEIICEVLEWDADDQGGCLVVRNIYEIHTIETQSTRMHALRPYMCFQVSDGLFQSINPDHISIQAIPSSEMRNQYETVVNADSEWPKDNDEDYLEKINEYINKMKKMADDIDSDLVDKEGNVIEFPTSKDKLH